MDPWLKTVLIMIACIVALMCYSAIVVASDADDREEEMYKEWDKPPKTEPQKVITTCVTVPMALLEANEREKQDERLNKEV